MLPPIPILRTTLRSLPKLIFRVQHRSFTHSSRSRSYALWHNDDEDPEGLRLTAKMPTPGLMFVSSRILDAAETSEEKYNDFYDNEHIPDVLSYPHGKVSKVAKRYKNTNSESKMPYLALYPLEDASMLTSPDLSKLVEDTKISKTFGGKDIYDLIEFDLRPYEKIQTYEGLHTSKPEPNNKAPDPSTHAHTVICVGMEPGKGQDQDFDDWYRKQHLDMLAMLPHYRRTTRYKRLDDEKPRYLALHEYDCKAEELSKDVSMVVGTEWSKKIIGESSIFDRDVFELITVQGDRSMQL